MEFYTGHIEIEDFYRSFTDGPQLLETVYERL